MTEEEIEDGHSAKPSLSNPIWYVLIIAALLVGLFMGSVGGYAVGRESVIAPLRETFGNNSDNSEVFFSGLDLTRTAIWYANSTVIAEFELTLTASP